MLTSEPNRDMRRGETEALATSGSAVVGKEVGEGSLVTAAGSEAEVAKLSTLALGDLDLGDFLDVGDLEDFGDFCGLGDFALAL